MPPHPMRAQAQTAVETWAIHRNDYQHLMLDGMVKRRKKYTDFLSKIPITQHLSHYEKLQVGLGGEWML